MSDKIALTERCVQKGLWRAYHATCLCIMPNFAPDRWSECDLFLVRNKSRIGHEYEIKLSRADFRKDFVKTVRVGRQDYGKHELLQDKTCMHKPNRFSFVLTEQLAAQVEVPKYAGLVIVTPGTMFAHLRVVKQAPLLHSVPVSARQLERMRLAGYYRFWNERNDGATALRRELVRSKAEWLAEQTT